MNAKLGLELGILLGIYWVGQVIEALLPFAFPASVIALLLTLVCLLTHVLRPEQIRSAGNFLQSGIAFFLIPIMVSLMNYVDLISEYALAFFTVCLVSTVLTFAAVAWTVQLTSRWMQRRKGGDEE